MKMAEKKDQRSKMATYKEAKIDNKYPAENGAF